MTHHEKIPAGWQPTDKTIHRTFRTTTNFVRGVDLIIAIRDLAEAAGHHPDIILTYPAVIVTLTTHDEGLVTMKDLAMAEQINVLWDTRLAGMPEDPQPPVARIEIDRELCIGAASCLAVAPEGFELDGENKAILKPDWRSLSDEAIHEAAKSCPVLAIYLYGPDGQRLFPES